MLQVRSPDLIPSDNQITDPSMKAFMDDVTLIAESRSHMEQLVTRLQELFKWAAMKIMLQSVEVYRCILKENRKKNYLEIELTICCKDGIYFSNVFN